MAFSAVAKRNIVFKGFFIRTNSKGLDFMLLQKFEMCPPNSQSALLSLQKCELSKDTVLRLYLVRVVLATLTENFVDEETRRKW